MLQHVDIKYIFFFLQNCHLSTPTSWLSYSDMEKFSEEQFSFCKF